MAFLPPTSYSIVGSEMFSLSIRPSMTRPLLPNEEDRRLCSRCTACSAISSRRNAVSRDTNSKVETAQRIPDQVSRSRVLKIFTMLLLIFSRNQLGVAYETLRTEPLREDYETASR